MSLIEDKGRQGYLFGTVPFYEGRIEPLLQIGFIRHKNEAKNYSTAEVFQYYIEGFEPGREKFNRIIGFTSSVGLLAFGGSVLTLIAGLRFEVPELMVGGGTAALSTSLTAALLEGFAYRILHNKKRVD